MNLNEWRRLAIESVTLFIAVVVCSICFSGRLQTKQEDIVLADNIDNKSSDIIKENSIQETEMIEEAVNLPEEGASGVQDNDTNALIENKIVVIDAGHGGMDEGTSSLDKKCLEKDYTLLVSDQIREILEEQNVQVYCTRTSDKMVSKKARVQLAKKTKADLLVSIHCNASTAGDSTAHGIESLYSTRKTKGTNLTNKRLAQIVLSNLAKSTGLEKRGVIRRENLYLLHHSKIPTTIVEIGYISNKNDMKYIMKKKGQLEIAQGISAGILQALEELE